MKLRHIIRVLLLLALPLSFSTRGSAASFQGKVVAVLDGERITVTSLNQSLKIKLLGVAAPAKNQPYAELAAQHLSQLVSDKFVVVRYTGLGQDGYVMGRVTLDNIDIGAQMIRDGVAWYDKSEGTDLSEQDRQQYVACEQLARSETRGLWQDPAPITPWEYRKQQLSRTKASQVSVPRPQPPARRGNAAAGLASDDLLGGAAPEAGSLAGKPVIARVSKELNPATWQRFEPENKSFSVLAPSDGYLVTYPILDGHGRLVDFHYVLGSRDENFYVMMWASWPNENATDDSVNEETIQGLLTGINRSAERAGAPFRVTVRPRGDVRLNGYAGKQYDLDNGLNSGVFRVLSKQVGDERRVFMIGVLHGPKTASSGDQFLNSLKIKPN